MTKSRCPRCGNNAFRPVRYAARRYLDGRRFTGGVPARRCTSCGELLISVHLPGLAALRGWAAGATAAVCATPAADSTGAELLAALGLPVVSAVRHIFEAVSQGDRVALDGDTGEVIVNPSASQAAAWRK